MDLIGQTLKRPNRIIDLKGRKFGRLTVLDFDHMASSGAKWKCSCDCGGTRVVYSSDLQRARTKSCGCLQVETNVRLRRKHGHASKDNETNTYTVWLSMKARCHTQTSQHYDRYGGRGIFVCNEWLESFENFLQDMGEKPEGKSLDRVDNEKGYSKDNCRWATNIEQANNKRNNRLHSFHGEELTLAEWSRKLGFKVQTLRSRYYIMGWSIEKILTTPVRGK